MGNLLQGCFLYRWALAIFAWFSRVADGSRVRRGISVCWESSKLAAFLHRCLSSGTVQIDESRTRRLLAGCNERLSGKSTSWVEFSVLYRIYRAVFTCGRGSRIFGWLFSGGMTAVLLFAIGLYVLIDYVLRDLLDGSTLRLRYDEDMAGGDYWDAEDVPACPAPVPEEEEPEAPAPTEDQPASEDPAEDPAETPEAQPTEPETP